ncbi:MAG: methyltransferase domain-containing protein [Candidatus Portnoybacteria bacterium]|nr:methyltransferase domain-containing protein [Candidatus Portnoybacteria bacterium]
MNQGRIENEIEHGKLIAKEGEEIWNWSSAAGRARWDRRCKIFTSFFGNEGKKVLEIGCGTGLFTAEIAKTKNEIWAIDISEDLLDLAKKRIVQDKVIFKIADACKTDFEDGFFDFVVGSSVLHHLDVEAAIKEFFRLLKPSGKFMFTEPNMMNPQIALQKNIPFLKKALGDSPDETAFFRWSIKKKLEKQGFKEIKVVPFDFMHPAVPRFLVKSLAPALNFLERMPIIKEIAGSLIISGVKR